MIGSFPLWKPTKDGRRIVALSLLRPFPLVLLANYGPAEHIGSIDGVTIDIDRHRTLVVCHLTLHPGVDAGQYAGWFLGPDVDSVRSVWAAGVTTMTGNLMGATLSPVSAWIDQQPIDLELL